MWRGEDLLLVRQAGPGEEPHWSLPGGILEDGELVSEGLAREVGEETGIRILELGALAYAVQLDSRRPPRFRRSTGAEVGFLATIWTFEVGSWEGDVRARDPDGVVLEAVFVPRTEAVERLATVWWHTSSVAYLRGEIEPGSLVLERWHADGRVEDLGRIAPRSASGS